MFKNDWFNCSQGALKIGFSNDGTEVIIAYADMVTAPDYLLVKTARYNIAENKLSTWNTVLETTVKTEDAVIDSVKNETVYATMYQNGDRITLSLPS